ncbi:BrnT family toxin [Candidatus Thiothrix sp. Deng01]|uniref:BrnT family toxin n=1 Tax=Candidatus Thiothrix phosphatis TaxID=3112415 RepID=A0ABU6D001_9GAMM|nr:BrnT family toxin [Candidatus Thiothrix sp. Deng01]MEB4591983.1 BrnT family toxin [Candidatus Thiothrix sp. Deng01]
MNFEWDWKKAQSNLGKHGVSFEEATTVFDDPMALTFDDPDHSTGEQRLLTFGSSEMDNLLLVSHTELDEGTIRIISARTMTRHERKIYQDG